MEVSPSVVLLTPHSDTSFTCWTAVLWGALHCGTSPMTLPPSEAYGSCPFPADATLGLQVAGAVVYCGCTSSGSLAHLPSFWVQHPPGALPCPFVLHPDEATVQGQIVSDRILEEIDRKEMEGEREERAEKREEKR